MSEQNNFNTAEIGYALFAYDFVHRKGNLH